MSNTIDDKSVAVQPVTGRTGIDLLVSSKRFILLLVVVIIAAAVVFMNIDGMASVISAAVLYLQENWYYSVPFVLGFLVYRYFLFYMVWSSVFLDVQGDKMDASYEISKNRFDRLTTVNGAYNPIPTEKGFLKYICKSVDFDANIIDLGDCHSKDESRSVIEARRECHEAFLKQKHDAERQVYLLNSEKDKLGYEKGVEISNELMEFFNGLLVPKVPSSAAAAVPVPDETIEKIEDDLFE